MEPIYKVQFIVKDKTLFSMQGGVKAILFTSDGICESFFSGDKPQNLYNSPALRLRLEKYLRHIVRFNVFLDAIVEKKQINDEIVLKLINCKLKNMGA